MSLGIAISLHAAVRAGFLRLPPSLGARLDDHRGTRLRHFHVREQVELALQVEHALRPLRRLCAENLRLLLGLRQLLAHLLLPFRDRHHHATCTITPSTLYVTAVNVPVVFTVTVVEALQRRCKGIPS